MKLESKVGAGLVPARIAAGEDDHFALQNPGFGLALPLLLIGIVSGI
jgi:hypothetical protein